MKKVFFKKVTVKNFLSVGEDPVTIEFNKGLNIITGRNKDKPDRQNAVGKSTIADAVYFAIFGDTLRQIRKDLIVNNITGGKTHIELDFDIQTSSKTTRCKVIRTLSPTRVLFYEDDIDKTRDSIANTTKYICSLINASPAIFQNCVIMTVNNATPFMAKNKIEKRKFIEDIFGMEVFSKMLTLARQECIDTKNEADAVQSRLEETQNTCTVHINQRDKVYDRRKDKRALYTERQSSNAEELKKLDMSLASINTDYDLKLEHNKIEDLRKSLKVVDNKVSDIVSLRSDIKAVMSHRKDTLSRIGTSAEKCPVCLNSMKDHDKQRIAEEKHRVKQEIVDMVDDINKHNNNLERIKSKRDTIMSAITSREKKCNDIKLSKERASNITSRIDQLHQWQEELKRDIYNLDHSDNEFSVLVEDNKARIKDLESQYTKLNAVLAKLDIVKFVLSEEGVKSYIVNKLLELLNTRMYYYLNKLDSNSVCVFNEYFEEEIVNEKGKICSYFNFSGAERKAIDLACLFAFSDMRRMQGGMSYNIAIYDELFDSSFDGKGIDLITEVLHERIDAYDECSMVISHRKESLKAATGEIILLEKQDGITRRVDYDESENI